VKKVEFLSLFHHIFHKLNRQLREVFFFFKIC